jgi:hypothetical protein
MGQTPRRYGWPLRWSDTYTRVPLPPGYLQSLTTVQMWGDRALFTSEDLPLDDGSSSRPSSSSGSTALSVDTMLTDQAELPRRGQPHIIAYDRRWVPPVRYSIPLGTGLGIDRTVLEGIERANRTEYPTASARGPSEVHGSASSVISAATTGDQVPNADSARTEATSSEERIYVRPCARHNGHDERAQFSCNNHLVYTEINPKERCESGQCKAGAQWSDGGAACQGGKCRFEGIDQFWECPECRPASSSVRFPLEW